MEETEKLVVETFTKIEPHLIDWGNKVDEIVLALATAKLGTAYDIKIPPKHRVKNIKSLLGKLSLKNYKDPIVETEDKVATRIVLLTNEEVRKVSEVLLNHPDWTCKKSRDLELLIDQAPNIFDYQSIHLVVNPKVENFDVGEATVDQLSCEIQIRTLLQHAYAEMSHDNVYKGPYKSDPKILRKLAKSMALMEATDDYFCDINKAIRGEGVEMSESFKFLNQLKELYNSLGHSKHCDQLDIELSDTIMALSFKKKITFEQIRQFSEKQKTDIQFAVEKGQKYIYTQPIVLYLLYLVKNWPKEQVIDEWPFSEDVLRSLFLSLGISPDY